MENRTERLAVLFKFWDYDSFKGREYTAIVACVGLQRPDGFEIESWNGVAYKYRKESPDIVRDVLLDFSDVKGIVIDPGLMSAVSVKRIKKIINVIEYDEEKHNSIIEDCINAMQ